jgi:YfiH family protein
LRTGGIGNRPFDSNNMGFHVGDDEAHVAHNRSQLASAQGQGLSWQWLNQTHSVEVARVAKAGPALDADAIYTNVPNIVCSVMTADCLPVFITNQAGSEIAIAHAGWRGLAAGVIENTVAQFSAPPEMLIVYFGPAIGPCHFEVGADVRDAFAASMPSSFVQLLFAATTQDKYLADLYGLAKARLQSMGVSDFFGGDACTVCDKARLFSYRRDGVTGRMANFICLKA